MPTKTCHSKAGAQASKMTKVKGKAGLMPIEKYVKASDISPHLDIFIRRQSSSIPIKKSDRPTRLEEVVNKWIKEFSQAKSYERRALVPIITQELADGGCRFLVLSEEKGPGGMPLYERVFSTRQIHAKMNRVLAQAVKAYEATDEGKAEKQKQEMIKRAVEFATASKPPVQVPVAAASVPKSVGTTASPAIESQAPPKSLFWPILSRDKSAMHAPLLTRNASMLSILSGTHSVDCLIGSMIGDGVFSELPKAVQTYSMDDSANHMSVEAQADAYNLQRQSSLGSTTMLSFEEWTRNMPKSPLVFKHISNELQDALAPPLNGPASAAVAFAGSGKLEKHVGFDATCVSPALSASTAPTSNVASGSVSSHHDHSTVDGSIGRDQPSVSILVRLNRLELTVLALLHENVNLRQLFNERLMAEASPFAPN
ncbi:hypothetical protein MPSEU_000834600 [Mayamaea pseudoterrestris]|nr:hypothetical protein MPSEU_000834600 [Mayamaea pseudoterrestris]